MKSEIIHKIKETLCEVLNLSKEVEILSSLKLKEDLCLDSMSSKHSWCC